MPDSRNPPAVRGRMFSRADPSSSSESPAGTADPLQTSRRYRKPATCDTRMAKTVAAAPRGGNLPEFPTPRQYSNTSNNPSERVPNRLASGTPPNAVRNYQQGQPGAQGHHVDPRYGSITQSPRHAPNQPPIQSSTRVPSNHSQVSNRSMDHGQGQYAQYQAYPESRRPVPVEQMRNVSIGSNHSSNPHHAPAAAGQTGGRRPVMGIQGRSGRSSPQINPNINFVGQAFGIAPEDTTREVPYDRVLWNIFCQVDSDGSGQITQNELSHALINGDFSAFQTDTVMLMIRLFDEDRNGTISFHEFEKLWKYLLEWRKLFTRFDTDASGTISFPEFSESLAAFGYRLSTSFVQFLFRYHDKSRTKEMSFDLFVQSCVTLRMFTDVFKKFDTDQDGVITIGFEDFLRVMIRNRQ